ncbi:MAG: PilZ domain-containing protein [Deltaproteobacteria bacterium]|nr:PilZ domain-containing protein [Deltaproteobacteria bacterium]
MNERECSEAAEGDLPESIVAQVVCVFADGETRTLYATGFSFVDAFIISVRPPPVGEIVTLTLCPKDLPPIPPIEARVMHARIDPSDVRRSGFGVMFTKVDDRHIEALENAIRALGLPSRTFAEGARLERRFHPRVATPYTAILSTPTGPFPMRVENLSISGALLVSDGGDLPPMLDLGALIALDVVKPDAPETISLTAHVARLVFVGETPGLGVEFVEVNETAGKRIEGLILHALMTVAEKSERR